MFKQKERESKLNAAKNQILTASKMDINKVHLNLMKLGKPGVEMSRYRKEKVVKTKGDKQVQKKQIKTKTSTNGTKKHVIEYLSITPNGTITYILNQEKAHENIKRFFIQELTATLPANSSVDLIEKIAKEVGEAFGTETVHKHLTDKDGNIIETQTIQETKINIRGEKGLKALVGEYGPGVYTTTLDQIGTIQLDDAFKMIHDIIQEIKDYAELDTLEEREKFNHIAQVGSFLDYILYTSPSGKQGNFWSDLGTVFEVIIRAGIEEFNGNLNFKIRPSANLVGGEKSFRDFNTSDVEVMTDELGKSIDGLQRTLGVSIKHTINFSKDKTMTYDQEKGFAKLYSLMGVSKEVGDKIINQYKYFILNYSILGEMESRENGAGKSLKSSGKRALAMSRKSKKLTDSDEDKGKGPQHARIDDNLRSHSEIIELYNLYSMSLGRIFLTMSLIGNIFEHLETGYPAYTNGHQILPMVLVDQNYAVFTYDVLTKLSMLLNDGSVIIEPDTAKLVGEFSQLGIAKQNAIFYKNIDNYSDLIKDSTVGMRLQNIHNKSFRHEQQTKISDIITINSAINLASTIERLSQSQPYTVGVARFK